MINTAIYYLNRLGLVFKRGHYFFYLLDCSQIISVDSTSKLLEIKEGEINNSIIFGWLTVDEAKSLISLPSNRMFLLQDGNESIASCWLQTVQLELDFIDGHGAIPESSAYVTHVVVKPQFRARGAAYELIERLVQVLQKEGIEKLFLCVDHRNLPMQKVIHKLGFVFYFGIRYFRALFLRRYYIHDECKPMPEYRQITGALPPDFHLIDIHFDKSRG